MPPQQKRSRLMNLLIAAPGVLAVGSAILWVVTLLWPSTFVRFVHSGRRFGLGSGFLYLNVEQPTSAATRAIIDNINQMERDPVATRTQMGVGNVSFESRITSAGSGDRLLFIGWNDSFASRSAASSIQTLRAVYDVRRVYWISPLIGVLPWVILWLTSICLRRRRQWVIQHRLRAGCCPGCGYDLRASTECCPECGWK